MKQIVLILLFLGVTLSAKAYEVIYSPISSTSVNVEHLGSYDVSGWVSEGPPFTDVSDWQIVLTAENCQVDFDNRIREAGTYYPQVPKSVSAKFIFNKPSVQAKATIEFYYKETKVSSKTWTFTVAAAKVTIIGPNSIDVGEELIFTADYPVENPSLYRYTWSTSNGSISIVSGQGDKNVRIRGISKSTGVTLKVIANGVATAQKQLTVTGAPDWNLTKTTFNQFERTISTFSGFLADQITSVKYTGAGLYCGERSSPIITSREGAGLHFVQSGTKTITAEITMQYGEVYTVVKTVNIISAPPEAPAVYEYPYGLTFTIGEGECATALLTVPPTYNTSCVSHIFSDFPYVQKTMSSDGREATYKFYSPGTYRIEVEAVDVATGRKSPKTIKTCIVNVRYSSSQFDLTGSNNMYTITPKSKLDANIRYEVHNLLTGVIVSQGSVGNIGGSIDLSALNKGMYVISLSTNENDRETHKITVK